MGGPGIQEAGWPPSPWDYQRRRLKERARSGNNVPAGTTVIATATDSRSRLMNRKLQIVTSRDPHPRQLFSSSVLHGLLSGGRGSQGEPWVQASLTECLL